MPETNYCGHEVDGTIMLSQASKLVIH